MNNLVFQLSSVIFFLDLIQLHSELRYSIHVVFVFLFHHFATDVGIVSRNDSVILFGFQRSDFHLILLVFFLYALDLTCGFRFLFFGNVRLILRVCQFLCNRNQQCLGIFQLFVQRSNLIFEYSELYMLKIVHFRLKLLQLFVFRVQKRLELQVVNLFTKTSNFSFFVLHVTFVLLFHFVKHGGRFLNCKQVFFEFFQLLKLFPQIRNDFLAFMAVPLQTTDFRFRLFLVVLHLKVKRSEFFFQLAWICIFRRLALGNHLLETTKESCLVLFLDLNGVVLRGFCDTLCLTTTVD
mmetsp:Transcript_24718/g.68334  ORF Transcript_24718/g.68334 Transcript_24718/m.68334 type:complete len:294 (-) Transcript_24718:8-889(-)